jgi:F420H(2)-dependent biliverdin reductase
MPRTTADLTESELEFLGERHLASLTTLRVDGSPHVVAIAFSYDEAAGLVRIISSDDTQKVRNIERDPRAVVSQVDGPRWLTLEGTARVLRDQKSVRLAVAAFEARYRPVRENPQRVAIQIQIKRVVGRA